MDKRGLLVAALLLISISFTSLIENSGGQHLFEKWQHENGIEIDQSNYFYRFQIFEQNC